MPSVNAGPSNSATVNTQTPMVNIQGATPVSGGVLVNQGAASVGTQSAPLLVAQCAIPVGIANTGTMGANGALTLGTALPAGASVLYGNCYMYFPAGAVYASSVAGFYLCKMAGTTTGTVYNNIYVATNGLPTIPTALVPVVDAGPGAYTGVTTIQVALSFSVPANVLGPNGMLAMDALMSWNNTAGAKTPLITWGGTTVLTGSATTTLTISVKRNIYNRGVTNGQVQFNTGLAATVGTAIAGSPVFLSVDTTQASTFAVSLTIATATDYIFFEYLNLTALYQA